MHLIVISGATRPRPKSNTSKIIEAFRTGFEGAGSTMEVYYLADRHQWDSAREAFEKNTDILFAFPLYVENIPGSMLEFLQTVPPKAQARTRLSFLVQGGFPEAAQSRCCEAFLKTLPDKLNCTYGGTLIRGDMFGVSLLGQKLGAKMVAPFIEVGCLFAQRGGFDQGILRDFSSPEHLSEKQLRDMNGMGKHTRKWCMSLLARHLGCKQKLDAKPYTE